MHKNSKTW